ncbi:MAG: nucleotide exchange factor GrpE [Woeseia sp.]
MSGQHDRPEAEQDSPDQNAERPSADQQAEQDSANQKTEQEGADEALAELKALADANWDKYLRAAAELENVRKRASRDIESAHKFALERFCTELLAVRDSLEMGLAAAEQADVQSLLEGKEATLKLLSAIMERFGVVELNPEGEPFNPEEHEAMSMQPSPDLEPGSVLTVIQKGYMLNGRLLRPARVVVASGPAEGDGDAK